MVILEENFKWHLEAFASELFKYCFHLFSLKLFTIEKKSFSLLFKKNPTSKSTIIQHMQTNPLIRVKNKLLA